jgi:hypothetical protein
MIKYLALISLIALRIIYNPSHTAAKMHPGFAEPSTLNFGFESEEKESCQFYEKVGNQKCNYRIKIVSKEKKSGYSPVLEVCSGV